MIKILILLKCLFCLKIRKFLLIEDVCFFFESSILYLAHVCLSVCPSICPERSDIKFTKVLGNSDRVAIIMDQIRGHATADKFFIMSPNCIFRSQNTIFELKRKF